MVRQLTHTAYRDICNMSQLPVPGLYYNKNMIGIFFW